MSGRGPTYERVQRLLEERRARASAQLAAQTQDSSPEGTLCQLSNVSNVSIIVDAPSRTRVSALTPCLLTRRCCPHGAAGHAGQLGRGRLQQLASQMQSPDSDLSFEFDQPAFISDAGALAAAQEILRNSYAAGQAEEGPAWRGASASGAAQRQQSGWQEGASSSRREQFQPPPGDFDDDDHLDHDGVGMPAARHGTAQFGQDGVLRGSYEAAALLSTPPVASASGQQEAGGGSPTLAELEAMLNQTMLQLNLSSQQLPPPKPRQPAREQQQVPPPQQQQLQMQGAAPARAPQGPQQHGDIRVPSDKDMAYGLGGGQEGPFDISDIWAMESQPSASQRSASQSDHAAYRGETQSGTEHGVLNSALFCHRLRPQRVR